jgi:hypothetical protein
VVFWAALPLLLISQAVAEPAAALEALMAAVCMARQGLWSAQDCRL